MSPQIIVPKATAENPVGGGNRAFPEGTWNGTIEEVRSRGLPPWAGDNPKAGFASSEGEVLGVQIGQTQPLEGQDDAGNSKCFVDFVVNDGGLSVNEIDPMEKDNPSWQMQRSAKLLASLALAVGAVEEVDGNVVVAENFVDELRSGAFTGQRVMFVVFHDKMEKAVVKAFGEAV